MNSVERSPETAPLQGVRCALRSTEQSTFRGKEKGEKAPRNGEEEGWQGHKGAKKKKTRKSRSETTRQKKTPKARKK